MDVREPDLGDQDEILSIDSPMNSPVDLSTTFSSSRQHRPSLFAAVHERNQPSGTLIPTVSSNNDEQRCEAQRHTMAVDEESHTNDRSIATNSCNEKIKDQHGDLISYFLLIRNLSYLLLIISHCSYSGTCSGCTSCT